MKRGVQRAVGCMLPFALLACGDILVIPGEASTTSNPVEIGVDASATALGQQTSLACPSFEPVGVSSDDAGIDLGPVSVATECPGYGGACEYGSSADRACDRLYTCQGGGWTNTTLDGVACFDSMCPRDTTPGATLAGTRCDLGPLGTPTDEAICNVADGTCACTTGAIGGHPHERQWVCAKSVLACPVHRPRVGTTCGSDGTFCDYGSCISKRGSAVICQSGQWIATATTCN